MPRSAVSARAASPRLQCSAASYNCCSSVAVRAWAARDDHHFPERRLWRKKEYASQDPNEEANHHPKAENPGRQRGIENKPPADA